MEFKNVSLIYGCVLSWFRYLDILTSTGMAQALNAVTFTIETGMKLGICGRTVR